MSHPPEPTTEQLEAKSTFQWNGMDCMAIWYPQMGGYVGRAVAVRQLTNVGRSDEHACFDVYVWHDGEFPFSETDGTPRKIHHCVADQFVDFGEQLLDWDATFYPEAAE